MTPGEIADRLTILAVKLWNLKDKSVVDQHAEALAAWKRLGLDEVVEDEMEELFDANNEAYEVIEHIYSDFRDEMYGTPCWSLFGDAKAQEKAEQTIKNCRRAHELNMERVRLKNAINAKAGAAQEVKSW
jgi:hypothetical protein